jgi:peptidyl-prolyl cis-trans isomerase SurA
LEPESEAGARTGVGSSKANARVHGLHSCGQSKESCLSIHLVANPLRCVFHVRAKCAVHGRVRVSMLRPIALAGLLAVAWVAGCNRQVQHSPDVWAVVNGKEIRKDEVEKYYRTRINPEGQAPSQEEALSLKLNVLDELINNEILIERAKKLNLEASDGEVEDKFTELKSPFTEDEFQRQLKERGVSVDDLKRDLRRQLSIQKLLNREVVAKISITDQDVADFYNANKAQFNVAEPQFRIAQIVVTPRKEPQIRNRKNDDATNEAEAQRKVKMLMDRLNSGADFAQLAMDYSEDMNSAATGGDMGYVPESALNQSDPALKKMVLGLKPGQVSQPIQLKEGYRILKLITRESPGLRGLSEPQVQQTIRDTLRNRKEQLLRAAYLAIARDEARSTNYLAQQVIETSGKLPDGGSADAAVKPVGQQ